MKDFEINLLQPHEKIPMYCSEILRKIIFVEEKYFLKHNSLFYV